jgi:hypothetical protein
LWVEFSLLKGFVGKTLLLSLQICPEADDLEGASEKEVCLSFSRMFRLFKDTYSSKQAVILMRPFTSKLASYTSPSQ